MSFASVIIVMLILIGAVPQIAVGEEFSLPEVVVTDVVFLNRIGLWGEEQVVVFNILSSVEQRVTVAVEAVNYTALLRGVEQVLASKTMTLNLSIGDNKQWASLKVDGSGWSLVAPRVRIISYQNDTSPENNERIGPAIQFGPLVDLRVTLYVFLAEYAVPARYPEITKYRVALMIESNYDLPGVGIAEINYTWISAYTMQKEVVKRSWNVPIKRGVNWVNDTFVLPWTNVTKIEAFFKHPYETIWADNYQVHYLELNEAIKILNITHPWTVTSGSRFNITVTVISNKKAEHSMFANITYYISEKKFATVPFGVSKWNITARAPQLPSQSTPQRHKMIVVAGADHYPDDNRYEAYITIVPPERLTSEVSTHESNLIQALLVIVVLILIMIVLILVLILHRVQRLIRFQSSHQLTNPQT
ncbi:MAG: hypothetical protein QW341_03210 [Candidatus Bathyarchaeia archaeon]